MTITVVHCIVCGEDTIPLEENGLCGWCMCDPATGVRDEAAYQRERNRINSRNCRQRQKVSVNDRSSAHDPCEEHAELQEVQA